MDPNGQLMDLGTVAAANIARALELPEEKVGMIRQAIRDEVSAMSTHFTLAFADISTAHEIAEKKFKDDFDAAVKDIKSTYRYVRANAWLVGATLFAAFSVGALAVALIR